MAGTTTKSRRTALKGADLNDLLVQFNLLVASMDGVLAKLDADAGVTDTNYASTWGTQYAKIGDDKGTAISS